MLRWKTLCFGLLNSDTTKSLILNNETSFILSINTQTNRRDAIDALVFQIKEQAGDEFNSSTEQQFREWIAETLSIDNSEYMKLLDRLEVDPIEFFMYIVFKVTDDSVNHPIYYLVQLG